MQNESLNNEKLLLDLIAQGDEFAFSKLFDHYHDKIYTVAMKLTKSDITAEEIVQDVFLKIWARRNKLTNIENFNAYLFIVTRNQAYKVLKSIAKNYKTVQITEIHHQSDSLDVSDLLVDKEYHQLLETAIDRLPTQQKKVYNLIKRQGLGRDEVAQQLQLQPETIKFHLAQAMKNIRAFCLLHLEMLIGFLFISYYFFGI